MKNEKYTFVDLFAGCGGLSEGFLRENFNGLCHVDFDINACNTLANRLKDYNIPNDEIKKTVLHRDLTKHKSVEDIINCIDKNDVDVVIGGPPCQAFSTVGRAQDPNSMKNDPRNYLYKHYLEVLKKTQPKIFLFENVVGLLSSKPEGEKIFPLIIKEFQNLGYEVCEKPEVIVLNSIHYGVPQIRKRVILIGIKKELKINVENIYNLIEKTHYAPDDIIKEGLKKYRVIKDAISDLPSFLPGEGNEEIEFKSNSKNDYVKIMRKNNCDKLYNHVARNHNDLDRERYKLLSENKWQLKDLEKVRPELIHYDPKHFVNRYTVQDFDKPGRTVVAHLYKDGNLFIHPDSKQQRTFTVREAARVQSFPDDFKFIGARTHQYKQVGNAVPPLMSYQIARAIKKVLEKING
ncbi:DNA cytosine methyltransferase [Arcobacter sp.]|uniref:DNA cytosine methyltransferase n=1 Tax=unclassified Arcobacter TaxID=2593671 RepID=UPI003AFF77F1